MLQGSLFVVCSTTTIISSSIDTHISVLVFLMTSNPLEVVIYSDMIVISLNYIHHLLLNVAIMDQSLVICKTSDLVALFCL